MPDKVTLEIEFPFWTAYQANLHLLYRSPMGLIASLFFPLLGMSLLAVWLIRGHEYVLSDYALLVVLFTFTPVLTAFSLFVGRFRNPMAKGPFMYTFDEKGMRAFGKEFSLEVGWPAVQRVRENKAFMFPHISPAQTHVIPLHQIRDMEKLEMLKAIVKRVTETRGEHYD